MANKLKIYACSGVDQNAGSFNYWTDGSNTLNNTQAENTLLAKINLCRAELRVKNLSEAQQLDLLNNLTLYCVCLYAVHRYGAYPDKLEHAGKAIGEMITNGCFENQSIDNAARQTELDELYAKFNSVMESNPVPNDEFIEWWKQNILERNKIGYTESKREKIRKAVKAAVQGLGKVDERWKQDADLGEYLTKAGEYFLYLYFTDEQLNKLPVVFRRKAKQQLKTYNYCKDLFVDMYGSEAEMQDIIRTGITADFGAEPEKVCDDIVAGRKNIGGIGIATEVLVAIVTAVFALVQAAIIAICSAVADIKQAEFAAVDKEAVERATPEGGDFSGMDSVIDTVKIQSWIPLLVIGAGVLFLLRR